MNPNVNYGLQLIMYQYWLIIVTNVPPIQDVNNRGDQGMGWEVDMGTLCTFCFSLHLKLLEKNEFYFLKKVHV